MASLSLGGVNLDVSGLVSQLMTIERQPLDNLIEKNSEYKSQLSELGRLKSALSSFQSSMKGLSSLDKFETYKASTSEAESSQTFSVSVDSDATAGIYSVDVQNLAQVNKWGSTSGFADKDTTTFSATANLDISDGTDSLSIDINGKTLEEIRDLINTEANSGNVGVSASIVAESSSSYQLVLTATDTGLDNDITVSSSGDAVTQLDLSEKQAALDASVLIDGNYTITSSSNEISNAISGVTLNLLDANTSGTAATLSVSKDTAAVTESINELVSSYNELMAQIKIYKTGALEGDSSLNSIQNMIRNELNTSAGLSSAFNYLSEIGVTTNATTGELELDSSVLSDAIEEDYEAISQLFAAEDTGIAYRMEALVDGFLDYDGLIESREDGINARIESNEDRQLTWEYRLEKIEARYLKQFSALDSLISQMDSTSSSLTQSLSSLPGFSS